MIADGIVKNETKCMCSENLDCSISAGSIENVYKYLDQDTISF